MGKELLAYYAKSLGLKDALYLVFASNTLKLADIQEQVEIIKGITIRMYIVQYDEEKDF